MHPVSVMGRHGATCDIVDSLGTMDKCAFQKKTSKYETKVFFFFFLLQ